MGIDPGVAMAEMEDAGWGKRLGRLPFHKVVLSFSLYIQALRDAMGAAAASSRRYHGSFLSKTTVQEVVMNRLLVVWAALVALTATPAFGAGKSVSYSVDGVDYEGYFSGAPDRPLLLLVHDWDGLTDYEIKRAEMLAELGYAVFAVDLFGAGVRPTETADKQKLTGALYGDRQKMRALLAAGFQQGEAQGGDGSRAVAFGYCFGGAAVLEMARSGADAKGFVSFHGGLTTPEGQDYSQTKGTVMVFHGTADSAVSMQDFADLAVQLEQVGVVHEMITYSGAPHAFTVFGTERYREEADRQSWNRFVRFLQETLN